MLQLSDIQKVYFIGIGGIGMSAVARYFHSKGVVVSGYDKTPTALTQQLEQSGIAISYTDDVALIPKDVELVVYTPAIPATHAGLQFYLQNNFTVLKRSDVLQIISEGSFNICIAGTHGKTSISTMIAHILRHSGFGCNAFLGGISNNYNTNFWSDKNNVCVIEADEYDRSFLKLSPNIAVISAMDADHLDIYGTADALQQAFIDFSKKIQAGGVLISKFGLEKSAALQADTKLLYSLQNENSDAYALNLTMHHGSYTFDVKLQNTVIEDVTLNMGGMHNVLNVIAAITVANILKIDAEKIKAAVADFKGIKRRFDYVIKNDSVVLIDDYAHHPEELKALITGAKTLFNGKKCTVIFQPHLFSRTKDFADEFAASLDMADEIILLPIYPARELPMPGVSSELIFAKMKNEHKKIMSKEELLQWASAIKVSADNDLQVIILAGAGDIDKLVEPIANELKK